MIAGSSTRSWLDDYPIYHYADCLLLLAEAKALLGKILQRKSMRCVNDAYGKKYFEANKATVAYPNDKGDFSPIILCSR